MEQTRERSGDPDWFAALSADYSAGVASTFLVHGTVYDYVEDASRDVTITDYLAGRLDARFSVVAYSPDQGITFPGEASDLESTRKLAAAARTRFERVTGLGAPALSPLEQMAAQAGGLDVGQGADLPRNPAQAIPALVQFLADADGGSPVYEDGLIIGTEPDDGGDGTGLRALVIVERLDLIAPPSEKSTLSPSDRALLGTLHRVGTLPTIQGRGGMLVMLAPSLEELQADLKQTSTGIRAVEIKPPSLDQRRAYLARIAGDPDRPLTFGEEMSLEDVARQTAGLGRRHIEDIALRATLATGGVMTRELVQQRRAELMDIEYSGILEVVDSTVTLDMVGGHELIIAHFREEVLPTFTSADPEVRADAPMGILMAGPSGTGKTFLAEGMASALQFKMIKWRPENLKSKWVGESEQKLAKAIAGTEANAPCLVFFDEVDQSVRRGEGGGGGGESVDNNMFGRILEWLSDTRHRGQILAVGATNRPDNLDAAFLRPGRFDVKYPLLVPQSGAERQDILSAVLGRAGIVATGDLFEALDDLGESTEGWTPAELENLVKLGGRISRTRGLALPEALRAARKRLKSATRDVERMTLLALSVCDDLAVVPEAYHDLVSEPTPVVEEARKAAPIGPRRGRNLGL